MVYSRFVSEAKHFHGADLNIKDKARKLRKNMTITEKILWSHLRNRQLHGMYFRRQHPFGIYILDFYCFEANLVIEIDGMIHMKNKNYDLERTMYLTSTGLKEIRFSNDEIENKIEQVLERINTYLTTFDPCR